MVPAEITNFLTMLKTLDDRQQSMAAKHRPPTGGDLPPAVQTPWQELLEEYSSNPDLRRSISVAEQFLLGRISNNDDATTSTLTTLDLNLNHARKLFGHLMNEEQNTTEDPNSLELPDAAMLEAVKLFIAHVTDATNKQMAAIVVDQPAAVNASASLPIAEAQPAAAHAVGQPAAAHGVGQPAAAHAVGQPAAANAVGQPAAANAKVSVGDVGIGKSRKWKDKYNGKRCKVLMPLSAEVRVIMLEGAAKGQEHKYFYKDFTVTEPVAVDPPNGPLLPPPNEPPATEGATESAVPVAEPAACAASAAVATQEEDISAQFLGIFGGS